MVKSQLEKREKWTETTRSDTLFVFKWTQLSSQINYELLADSSIKQMANHISCHAEITTKDRLFRNMAKFCENY